MLSLPFSLRHLVGLTGDNAIQYLFASNGGTLDDGLALRGDASLAFSLLLIFGSLFLLGKRWYRLNGWEFYSH